MTSDALFPVDVPAPAPARPRLSAERRRTIKQAEALTRGLHPLSVYLKRPLKLHADAAPPDDRQADGLRCGACAWRERNHHQYLKCGINDGARASFGAATDLRSWWPACVDYEASS